MSKPNIPNTISLLIAALCFCVATCAQTDTKKIAALYYARQYNEAIAAAKENIIKGYELPSSNLITGRCYVDMHRSEAAIPYLRAALQMDADKTWISGWGHAYLGVALVLVGKKDSGIIELNQAIALRKTDNSAEFARNQLNTLVDPESLIEKLDLVKVESDSIIYYFQDSGRMLQPVYRYIQRHDSAYVALCRIFHPIAPQKLRFFVFTHKKKAEKALGRELGFTRPREAACFSMADQTTGHEMCHFISFWANGKPTVNESRLINEGIAVCFDMQRYDVFERAKTVISEQGVRVSVLDIWREEKKKTSEIIYPIGGAFIRHLYERMKNEDFVAFANDQSFTHLRALLGADFDEVIRDFDLRVGLGN